ncbi:MULTISPECIES: transglycosylase SLT domain-containing protein [unclassified Lentimicrobium]|uniref:transglycosylase SLT domain-containing protein n=1 Tax=unclassified Lentimicrobium TaxID=2677434 RepID=UPI00155791D5|nr:MULTISPECIES: transporter substrate-binding domain-containing protein [unclassified Lentimicrobium]NPD47870.1 transporter substrate-binding domain-containing protein [Lentimicrobium sp. S6]NPD83547.1 transporter substrate-binding domain-containing protein [Lentimicrobium sp. L6]NPD85964.1 transporter substrate-binding domain-containing protein [Lentimicrobium sp. L6]
MLRGLFKFFIFTLLLSQFTACESPIVAKKEPKTPSSHVKKNHLKKIQEKGKIVVSTDYNSHGYFIYKGTPMGFQFELLNSFADYLGVKLEISVRNDLNEALLDIKLKKCDLLAMDLAITAKRRKSMLFTEPIYQSRQVLVQKMPDNWRKMQTWDEIESHLLRDAIDLQGKTVHIQKGSVFYNRLNHINIETGGDILIIEDDLSVDELIEKVENGEIKYTVCDSHVGAINKKYHKNIDIETMLGAYSQNLAWALPLGSDSLLLEINQWLKEYKKSKEFYYVYNKYFKNSRTTMMAKSEYNSNQGGKISPYDELIKKYSEDINWDWRLLASLIYQESKFDPNAESWSGAFGLMQMMPQTAEQYGVSDSSAPSTQIEAGAKYIKLIDRQLEPLVPDSNERKKFVMASYNAGLAHVLDAQRLAKKYNKDPEKWNNNVDYYLLNKSNPKYYQDTVVYYGYCRGSEPYKYVNEIYERYQHYTNLIKDSIAPPN